MIESKAGVMLLINHLRMDVASWCYKWVDGWDGMDGFSGEVRYAIYYIYSIYYRVSLKKSNIAIFV